MKRTYLVSREKVVYYRKEVEFDTNNWDQILDLLECVGEDAAAWAKASWAVLPEHLQQEVVEYFESTLEDEDITDPEYQDTEEWNEGNDVEISEEDAQ